MSHTLTALPDLSALAVIKGICATHKVWNGSAISQFHKEMAHLNHLLIRHFQKRFWMNPFNKHFILSLLPAKMAISTIEKNAEGTTEGYIKRKQLIKQHVTKNLTQNNMPQVVSFGVGLDVSLLLLAQQYPDVAFFGIDRKHNIAFMEDFITHCTAFKAAFPSTPNYIMISADLTQSSPEAVLKNTGFDRTKPTFFIIEGVLHYLPEDVVSSLFDFMGSMDAKGIFDVMSGINENAATKELKKAAIPYKYSLKKEDAQKTLQQHNLEIEDIIPTEELLGKEIKDSMALTFYTWHSNSRDGIL